MDKQVKYELWKIPAGDVFNKAVHFAVYDCPSALAKNEKREYTKGVPVCKSVAEAMAWGMSSDEYKITPQEWMELVPLLHES